MARKRTVVLGMVGTSLDGNRGPSRWERWRPTVALCQHEDLMVDRLELLLQSRHQPIADVITEDIARISPETEVRSHAIELDDPWDFEAVYATLHDFARGYPFKPEHEDYLVHITTGTHVAQICMFLVTESRHFPARLIQTSPPKGSIGAGSYTIIDLDLSRYDKIASRFQREKRESLSFLKAGIETRNAAFNRIIEQIERVSIASRAPLLLTGPTGAGKSHLARRVFELKKARRQVAGGFVEVNCATLRGDSAMSSLFGHVKGAFTGAVGERPGFLRKADGGVLFLDEIGELGLDEQAMLLHAIEEKVFYPVGSDREVKSDFQLIAGTNRELGEAVSQGKFREDLLARINLWTFRLPGLRDRLEDVEPNLAHELDKVTAVVGTHVTFSREARERFLTFATSHDAVWAGNFRDFNAAITRMSTLADGGRITREVVDEEITRLRDRWASVQTPGRTQGSQARVEELLGKEATDAIDLFDLAQLEVVLEVCQSARSLSDAGRTLFSKSRLQKTSSNDADRLRKYLARFGLGWDRVSANQSRNDLAHS